MTIDLEGKTEIGKPTRASLEDCSASRAEHLCIGCGHPETDRSYCVNQHANMRMLVHVQPTSDPSSIQLGKWGVYMKSHKSPFSSFLEYPQAVRLPAILAFEDIST